MDQEHALVKLVGLLRADLKLLAQMLRDLAAVLVADLMFQACPEVHRSRPDLDLDPTGLRLKRQPGTELDDQMIAAIAARLGVREIVFLADDPEIILRLDDIDQLGDVARVGADDPRASDIRELGGGAGCKRQAPVAQLASDACQRLDAAVDVFDRVALAERCVVVVEIGELGLDNLQRATIRQEAALQLLLLIYAEPLSFTCLIQSFPLPFPLLPW